MSQAKYHKDTSVTAEANKLVYGDRGQAYSHPLDDYKITAGIWTNILRAAGVLAEGQEVSPYHAALCMVGVKLSRASRNVGHRDSLVDGAGYFEVANEIHAAHKDALDEFAVSCGVQRKPAAEAAPAIKVHGWARPFLLDFDKPRCIRSIRPDGWVLFYDNPVVWYNPDFLAPCYPPADH